MIAFCDSSILIAALIPTESHHAACKGLMESPDTVAIHVHALNETFATLTGGALGFRVDADLAARAINDRIVKRSTVIVMDQSEVIAALQSARKHGVRGGAVYDYMHLVAARKAGADALYTLNLSDFLHLRRDGDPQILLP